MTILVSVLVAATLLLLAPARAVLPDDHPPAPPPGERALVLRLRLPLAATGGCGGWALVGGLAGVVVGVVSAVVVWVVLGRVEDPSVVRRRERLAEDLPTGVDLLGACLDAGAATESALVSVARAIGGPVGEELVAIHHRLEVGVDPVQVWRAVAGHPQLGPLGRAVGRAHETGAPVGQAVRRLAEELRERARADVEVRARSIEVKAAAPLGLCLLPAFIVLGIVPMVVGVFRSMELFR